MADSAAPVSSPSPSSPAPVSGAAGPSYELLQHLIDQAAHLNVVSVTRADRGPVAVQGPEGVVGFRIREDLFRLAVTTTAPTFEKPILARCPVGERLAGFDHLWMLAPDDYVALPGELPPPTVFDPTRPQRFVMLDARCVFEGGGNDGFVGFGTGRTLPLELGGRQRLMVDTVGTVLEGFGSMADHRNGTFMHCGELDLRQGFIGNMLLRVMDPQGSLRFEESLPELLRRDDPEPDITYVVLRGEAVPDDPVSPKLGPDGKPIGLIVEQGLRLLGLDAAVDGSLGGLRTTATIGPKVGRIIAHVVFDPASATGAPTDPIPFTTWDEMLFEDSDGRLLGKLIADSSEGRVFGLELGGAQAIRFGGVGRVLRGEGPFAGMSGQMSDNSVVVFEPHVSASVYLMRLYDPEGRFRAVTG